MTPAPPSNPGTAADRAPNGSQRWEKRRGRPEIHPRRPRSEPLPVGWQHLETANGRGGFAGPGSGVGGCLRESCPGLLLFGLRVPCLPYPGDPDWPQREFGILPVAISGPAACPTPRQDACPSTITGATPAVSPWSSHLSGEDREGISEKRVAGLLCGSVQLPHRLRVGSRDVILVSDTATGPGPRRSS